MHKEREDRKIERERQRRRAKAQVTIIMVISSCDTLACYFYDTYFLESCLKAEYEKEKKREQSSSSRNPGTTPGGFPGGTPGGFPGGMPGGFPGAMPGGMPGNVDFSKILNVSTVELVISGFFFYPLALLKNLCYFWVSSTWHLNVLLFLANHK